MEIHPTNPVFHIMMKHLSLDYFLVREKISTQELQVRNIPSSQQLVDLLTKAISKTQFLNLISKIGVVETSPNLRGNRGNNIDKATSAPARPAPSVQEHVSSKCSVLAGNSRSAHPVHFVSLHDYNT